MSRDKGPILHGGQYAERRPGGALHPRPDLARGTIVPDAVICRRIADYSSGPPAGAGLAACARCQAPIAFNLAGPYPDVIKICMQCSGIEPLPIGGRSSC